MQTSSEVSDEWRTFSEYRVFRKGWLVSFKPAGETFFSGQTKVPHGSDDCVEQVHSPRFEGSKRNPLMGQYQSDPSQENRCLCKYFKQMKLKAGNWLYGGQKRSEATMGWWDDQRLATAKCHHLSLGLDSQREEMVYYLHHTVSSSWFYIPSDNWCVEFTLCNFKTIPEWGWVLCLWKDDKWIL